MAVLDAETDRLVILLVDDEPGIRNMLTMLLEEEGYQVITAGDGREALTMLEDIRPDLIITDYMMPYVTGAQLIGAIRNLPAYADLPVLLMSAALPTYIDPDVMAIPFLSKPADLNHLLAVIEQLIVKPCPSVDYDC
ncbi:response regulator [Stutzerimonas stutzeri]|uniref:response regulator n=1 Tax=Stutzerimonas stutzeri TaxID=316 RepID=UPI00069E4E81|nr:response regulator [Stutzerimonas stutzeri]MCQ4225255.1 response regulator [Stutzerimonas stutzeri]MDH0444471.1 response regulator [Stutzerimonas stutzeri]